MSDELRALTTSEQRAKPPYYGCEGDSEDRHTWLFCEHDTLAVCASCGEEWDDPADSEETS